MTTPYPKLFDPDAIVPASENDEPTINHLGVVRVHFPRIATLIELMWGTTELQAYLSNLIVDDRHYISGEARQGFPNNVLVSLLVIYNKHSEGAPITDVWVDD